MKYVILAFLLSLSNLALAAEAPDWVALVQGLRSETGGISAKLNEIEKKPGLDEEILAQIRTANAPYREEALLLVQLLKRQSLLGALLDYLDKQAASGENLSAVIQTVNALATAENFAQIEANYLRNFPLNKNSSSRAATLGLYFQMERAPDLAALLNLVDKGSPELKIQAAQIAEFGILRDIAYAQVMLKVLKERPAQVRAAAAISLDKLTKAQLEPMRSAIVKCTLDRKKEVKQACDKLMLKLSEI